MSPRNFFIAVVLASVLVAGVFVAAKFNRPAEPRVAFVIPMPDELPQFSLLDQSGNPVGADTFRGRWDLVFFGFTNCPDICPTTLQVLASAKRQLVEAGSKTPLRIVLVSVDPERDTPELLGNYVDHFGKDNLGVTGELSELTKLTAALGIYFEKTPAEGGNYGVDHTAAVLVINPHGQFSALFSAPHVVSSFVHDLPIITGED